MKHQFVIFGNIRDYLEIMFKDAVDAGVAEYIPEPILNNNYNTFIKGLYKVHNNPYLNWKFELPFKKAWYPLYYDKNQSKPICFVFLMNWLYPRYRSLFEILRKKYPECRLVAYLEDLVSSRPKFDINILNEFDCVITYDNGDAVKYGFHYHPTFLSKLDISYNPKEKRDVNFVGVAKDRTEEIYSVFDYLHKNGITTDFIISRLPSDKGKKSDITYIEKDLSYTDYLSHVVNSNCILEIMHHNARGYTLRTWEALLYNKKLITNNKNILKSPFYRPEQFLYFDKVTDIPVSEITKKLSDTRFDAASISPVNFLKYVDRIL